MELINMKWIWHVAWVLLCHACFFSAFRVVTVVSSQSKIKFQAPRPHYWYVFQFLFVKAMDNPSLSLLICNCCRLPMLVGYNYGSEDGEGAWLPVWVGHCEVTTRVLCYFDQGHSFFASTRCFQSVTLWAGQAAVWWCGLMGLLSFNIRLLHRIDSQFQSEKSRAEKQFLSCLACIIGNYDGSARSVSNTVRPLETQVKVDMDIANQIVVWWILFASFCMFISQKWIK